MFKSISLSVLLAFTLCLTGCDWQSVENEADSGTSSIFTKVEETPSWMIVYDKETKVMYTVSTGSYNLGTFTLLVNPDGTPKTYTN